MARRKLTRKEKRNLCEAVVQKSFKLLGDGVLTTKQYETINGIIYRAEQKHKLT